ncbi:MAG: DoxX family protein [Opitutales bacterium]
MKTNIISWGARILVAFILGQTLFFKFTDAPETVELFAKLDAGAAMYKTIGLIELIACILILVPRTIVYGAFLAAGLMAGAIFAHITKIGFSGPDGTLALMAIIAFISSLTVIYLHRRSIPLLGSKL